MAGCAVSMYNCGLEQFRDSNNHAAAAEWCGGHSKTAAGMADKMDVLDLFAHSAARGTGQG